MTRLGNTDAALTNTKATPGPVASAAPVAGVKSKPQTMREFERLMRDLGYSQREAKTIAMHGFKALDNTVEAETHSQLFELTQLLEKNLNLLKETQP